MILQQVQDLIVGSAVKVLRVAAHERNVTIEKLKEVANDVIKDLIKEQEIAAATNEEISALIKRVEDIIDYGYIAINVYHDLRNPVIAKDTAQDVIQIFDIVLGKPATELPTEEYFNSVSSDVLIQGAPQADWWKAQAEDIKLKTAAQMRIGLVSGETNQQIIQRIVGTSTNPGVMDIAKRNASTLVQTMVQAVANDARRATFRANDNVVKGMRQVSTLDSHTSDICIAYSGEEWDLEGNPINGSTLPYNGGCPRHWNCRSVEVPITKTFKELGLDIAEPDVGTRSSDEGPIKADTTFEGFLSRKSEAYQNEMLGFGRAQLWRDGKITLKDLVNGDGRPLNLDELRNKDNIGDLFKKISEPDGGFTYQPLNAAQPKTGFAVSPYPELSFAADMKDFDATALIDYIHKNQEVFANKDHFLGAWHDPESDKIFLDISVVSNTAKEAEKLALENDQIAYFDLAKGASVVVNKDATSGGVT